MAGDVCRRAGDGWGGRGERRGWPEMAGEDRGWPRTTARITGKDRGWPGMAGGAGEGRGWLGMAGESRGMPGMAGEGLGRAKDGLGLLGRARDGEGRGCPKKAKESQEAAESRGWPSGLELGKAGNGQGWPRVAVMAGNRRGWLGSRNWVGRELMSADGHGWLE